MKFKFALALAGSIFATTAIASPMVYDCNVESRESHGWIAQRYIFVIDNEKKVAFAESRHHDQLQAKLKVDRKDRYKISWPVRLKTSAGFDIGLRYSATISPVDNTVVVRGRITSDNAANKPVGHGTCSVSAT